MNLLTVFLLSIVSMCSGHFSVPTHTNVAILISEEGCAPQDIVRVTTCGCFTTLFAAPTDKEIRAECRKILGVAVANSQFACDSFLIENGTNYNFTGIIHTVNDVINRCFAGPVAPHGYSQSPPSGHTYRATFLFNLLIQLSNILGENSILHDY